MTQLSIPTPPPGIYFGLLGNVPSEWLVAQTDLTVLMKDGYSFFRANRDVFADRFADPAKKTTILISHPDTPFIEAVTDKDYHKTVESQRNDFMQTVLLIQDIAATVAGTGAQPNVAFAGYDDVPTENIFVGDTEAIKKFYPTQSYRGALEGVMIDSRQGPEAKAAFNRASATCATLLDGQSIDVGNEIKQRPPARSLWDYYVFSRYRTADFRL